ncbi:MAG: hypothetical protein U1E78_11435 [Gammaproteobacteria bacterium]
MVIRLKKIEWISTAALIGLLSSGMVVKAEETGLPPLGEQQPLLVESAEQPKETAPVAYYEERANLTYFKEFREIIGYLHRLDLLSQNLYVKAEELDSDAMKLKKAEVNTALEGIFKKINNKKDVLKSYGKEHQDAVKAISLDLDNLSRIEKSIEKSIQSSNALFEAAVSENGDFSDSLGSNVMQRAALFLDINTSELEGAIDLDKNIKGPLQRFRIMSVLLNNKFILRNFQLAHFNMRQYLGVTSSSEGVPKTEDIEKISGLSAALLNDEKYFLAKEPDSEKTTLYANIYENELKLYKLNLDFYNRLKNANSISVIKEWFETYSILLKELVAKRQELDQAIALEEGGTGVIINPNAEKEVRGNESKNEGEAETGTVDFEQFFKR